MTLRTRLTSAFLATVLAPVVVGALVAGGVLTSVARDQAAQRLSVAATAVRTSVTALCGQLGAVAQAVAAAPAPDRAAVAQGYVVRGLATGVHIETGGEADFAGITTPGAPPPPWADCPPGSASDIGPASYEGLAARVDLVSGGQTIGSVYAAQTVDRAFLNRLSDAIGVDVELRPGSFFHAFGDSPEVTDPADDFEALPRSQTTTAPVASGPFNRVLGAGDGLPLPLTLSVPEPDAYARYAMLAAIVLITAAAAVLVAWWLARTTTAPLANLVTAVDRVADGDLQARVPVRGNDEIGQVASAFNRMTGELESYVDALTASRDQLRGQLGVLGDTLSSTHDLHRILQVILQTARHAAGARAGVVLLIDPATGLLTGQCAEGLDPAIPIRVPIGEGLLGSVAATGVPVRGRTDRDGPVLLAAEPRCKSYVVVPFTLGGPLPSAASVATVAADPASGPAAGPGGSAGAADLPQVEAGPVGLWPAGLPAAQGVLAVYDRVGRDEFDDGDLDTLRTFAGQASVAVDNVRVHEEAQRLSVTDSLTGLLNYRSMLDCLRREADRAHRFGRRLCVLALDLDRFKEINDSYGHAAGDVVLAEFARRVRAEIREVDLAFRHGGEEFVVLLPETDLAGGVAVADRLCASMRTQPVLLPRGRVDVTVSIGIAVFPEHGATGSAVLQAADDALYAAKAAGRDRHRTAFSPGVASVPPSSLLDPPTQPSPAAAGGGGAGSGGAAAGSGVAGDQGESATVTELTTRGASSGPHPPRQVNGR
ncbi:diguanylate cyclase (GGDEF)-like protein [Hamadaea flava]|uniref:Diguanylate cyclase n=1 Tax=Hamadaea flava TaxID=1742688 RepID=A0ABV8LIZ6_9ACTN|nr:diguanylate cyclase [Hamadaea flava]MCP2325559.1 diguanylate cyclase (GGDEF)-like protein [Hamadaea flava]